MYGLLGQDNIWQRYNPEGAKKIKNLNIEKIAFKVFQIKSLAMHITNQKLRFNKNVMEYSNLLRFFFFFFVKCEPKSSQLKEPKT